MTNAEKFEEVFGFVPSESYCPIPDTMCRIDTSEELLPETAGKWCTECPYFYIWDKEYETPEKLPFE